jgi:hypothetical protein
MELETILDNILRFLNIHGFVRMVGSTSLQIFTIDNLSEHAHVFGNDFNELIEILIADDYVSVLRNTNNQLTQINIKFKGRLFLNQGGYVGKSERKDLHDKISRRNDRLLRCYTLWLAIGTVSLVVVELAKWYFEKNACH